MSDDVSRETPNLHVANEADPPAPLVKWSAAQHRHAAEVILRQQITYSGRNTSPATDLVLATVALAHATLGGTVPETADSRVMEAERHDAWPPGEASPLDKPVRGE